MKDSKHGTVNWVGGVIPVSDSKRIYDVISQAESSLKDLYSLFSLIDFRHCDLKHCWPYWVTEENQVSNGNHLATLSPEKAWPENKISQSTNSMIVSSLVYSTNRGLKRAAVAYSWGPKFAGPINAYPDALTERLNIATTFLAEQWHACKNESSQTKTKKDEIQYTRSDTYGSNDILTLSWYFDIANNVAASEHGAKLKQDYVGIKGDIEQLLWKRIRAYGKAKTDYEALCVSFNDGNHDTGSLIGDSTYLLLRFVRAIRFLSANVNQRKSLDLALSKAAISFQSRLHDHLSYSEITDSRFDPSELAFCLEGLLIIRPELVDEHLAQRVFEVMRRAQSSVPYWRTETPMIVTQKGQLLFPISVEAATSLLTSLSIGFSECSNPNVWAAISADFLPCLQRYWDWLKTRYITLRVNGSKVGGWHSRHVANPLIHTWETSQVTEFLVFFNDQLRRVSSQEALQKVKIKATNPTAEEPDWDAIVSKYEGAKGLPAEYKSYEAIGKDFIEPIKKNDSSAFKSMMFYGPPGTGKTSLAKQIAGELELPFIYLTVSDFLSDGEANIEFRVKSIFDALKKQPRSMVFFDEFDQFILDRDSFRFSEQQTVFQFLTPGMLTKLVELYESDSVIFAIATNYEERIDLAISRPGRIDRKYLIVPPSIRRRGLIISSILEDMRSKFALEDLEKEKILNSSVFLSYKEILNALKTVNSKKVGRSEDFSNELVEELKNSPRSIQFSMYKYRFTHSIRMNLSEKEKIKYERGPILELSYLFYLAYEVAKNNHELWREYCGDFFTAIKELKRDLESDNQNQIFSKLNPKIKDTIESMFS